MASEHHQNPVVNFIYISCGALLSILQNPDIYYQGAFDVVKAFFVGGMGALGAYVFNKYLLEKGKKYIEKKSKDVCK